MLFFSFFCFLCTSIRSLLNVSNLGIFTMMILLTSCFMMGKGPNGEWDFCKMWGWTWRLPPKPLFWKCPHPGPYPALIPTCFLFRAKFHTVAKVWIFIFANSMKSWKFSRIFLKNSSSRYSKYIKIFLKLFVYPNWLWMITTLATSQNRREKNKKQNKTDPNPWIGRPYSLWQSG